MTQTQTVIEDLGWIFRRQSTEDHGVDAHIEIVDNEHVRGWLLGVQIKGGRSYFDKPADNGWWFGDKAKFFRYWLDYSIPVIVVLANLETGQCYWQFVTESTVVKGGDLYWRLEVPQSQRLDISSMSQLRHAAEQAARKASEHRPVGASVTTFSPSELEVHLALPGISRPAQALPEYVLRPHDDVLDELVAAALSPDGQSGLAVLVGASGTGKTRALYEALHRSVGAGPAPSNLADAGWRLWPRLNPLPPRRFLDELALVGPRTVVWLNEAHRYLLEPPTELRADIATALDELLADRSRGPVLVLGTLWHNYWDELTHRPERNEIDPFLPARRLLAGRSARVPDVFTSAEVGEARKSDDGRIAAAASQITGMGVTQFLAGAPNLLQRYERGSVDQRAVIHAAMDARRLGHGEQLTEDFLREAARAYLTGADRERADHDPSWFQSAIVDLERPGAASGPVLDHTLVGFRLDDILDQHGRTDRMLTFPPDEFWSAVAESDVSADNRVRLAESAASCLRLRTAVHIYEAANTPAAGKQLHDIGLHFELNDLRDRADDLVETAVAAGYPEAWKSLARKRHLKNHLNDPADPSVLRLLRNAVALGDLESAAMLAGVLEQRGHQAEAEAVARQAVERGAWEPTVSVADWRDLDFPDEAEHLVLSLPDGMRTAALVSFVCSREGSDNPEGAERLALSAAADGHVEVLVSLAEVRAGTGQRADAKRLLEQIDWPELMDDRLRLALIHVAAGNEVEARSLVKSVLYLDGPAVRARRAGDDLDVPVDQLAVFIRETPAYAVESLLKVLQALGERNLVETVVGMVSPANRGVPQPLFANDDDDDGDQRPDETDVEVGAAYATLAEFHAKRGEFQEAEALAIRAAAAGIAGGLLVVSAELLDRGSQREAERLALYAVNVEGPFRWAHTVPGPSAALLAETRDDPTTLVWGLNPDGTTADTW